LLMAEVGGTAVTGTSAAGGLSTIVGAVGGVTRELGWGFIGMSSPMESSYKIVATEVLGAAWNTAGGTSIRHLVDFNIA